MPRASLGAVNAVGVGGDLTSVLNWFSGISLNDTFVVLRSFPCGVFHGILQYFRDNSKIVSKINFQKDLKKKCINFTKILENKFP